MKKIYKFVDINETAPERENIIDVFIDGNNLDRVVAGYTTLNVYGRLSTCWSVKRNKKY